MRASLHNSYYNLLPVVAHLLKAINAQTEKLGNVCVTRNSEVTVGRCVFFAVPAEVI
jgi:hypothetical protein